MINKIVYHPEAEVEINESMIYYEKERKGQGYKFQDEVRAKIEIIQLYPDRYSKRHNHYRETQLKTFPYLIVYRYNKIKNLITISAIHHTKRNPKNKYRK